MNYTYQRGDDIVVVFVVNSKTPCDGLLKAVAVIHEPDSENPGVEISTDSGIVGVNALKQLCEEIQAGLHLA